MADELECESVRRRSNAMRRWIWAHFRAQASEVSGSVAAAGFSAVVLDSRGGWGSIRADKSKGDGWHEATVTAAAPAEMAGAEIFLGNADNVGASEGVNRDSGADEAP